MRDSPRTSYEERILSPYRRYSRHSTTRYQAVFTDVSVLKACYVWLGMNTYLPHLCACKMPSSRLLARVRSGTSDREETEHLDLPITQPNQKPN